MVTLLMFTQTLDSSNFKLVEMEWNDYSMSKTWEVFAQSSEPETHVRKKIPKNPKTSLRCSNRIYILIETSKKKKKKIYIYI